MTSLHRANTAEEPDLFRFRNPGLPLAGIASLSWIQAAHMAGFIPGGTWTGAAVALGGGALLAKACVYRRR